MNGGLFHEIADLPGDVTRFENTGITSPNDRRYRIRTYHRGGYSAYAGAEP